jgi:hypothetical protein
VLIYRRRFYVMPAQAGIHDFAASNKGKSWMPA